MVYKNEKKVKGIYEFKICFQKGRYVRNALHFNTHRNDATFYWISGHVFSSHVPSLAFASFGIIVSVITEFNLIKIQLLAALKTKRTILHICNH